MWRYTFAMLIVLTLAGCASGGWPTKAPMRSPPVNLLTPCPPLPLPASAKGPDLLVNHVLTAKLYHGCREQHRALADWANHTGGGND